MLHESVAFKVLRRPTYLLLGTAPASGAGEGLAGYFQVKRPLGGNGTEREYRKRGDFLHYGPKAGVSSSAWICQREPLLWTLRSPR